MKVEIEIDPIKDIDKEKNLKNEIDRFIHALEIKGIKVISFNYPKRIR